jgi:hypothetical protein
MTASAGDPPRDQPARGLHEPIIPPGTPAREVASVNFADLLRMLGEGIADAQLALDRSSAMMVEELAARKVSYVPELREVVDEEGRVSHEASPPRDVSLLDLGLRPAFYQFSESRVEVSLDIAIAETATEPRSRRSLSWLRAGTAALRAERKLHREVGVHSKLTATLVPVPMPAGLEPARTRSAQEA